MNLCVLNNNNKKKNKITKAVVYNTKKEFILFLFLFTLKTKQNWKKKLCENKIFRAKQNFVMKIISIYAKEFNYNI